MGRRTVLQAGRAALLFALAHQLLHALAADYLVQHRRHACLLSSSPVDRLNTVAGDPSRALCVSFDHRLSLSGDGAMARARATS